MGNIHLEVTACLPNLPSHFHKKIRSIHSCSSGVRLLHQECLSSTITRGHAAPLNTARGEKEARVWKCPTTKKVECEKLLQQKEVEMIGTVKPAIQPTAAQREPHRIPSYTPPLPHDVFLHIWCMHSARNTNAAKANAKLTADWVLRSTKRKALAADT